MTKKQIFRGIAFFLVVCCVLVLLCDLFELDNTTNFDKRSETFRNLEKNTIDAVFIGTSGVDRYWIAPKAYEDYGMTVFTYSSDAMPSWLYVNRLKEIYTYQNPQLVIVDIRAFQQGNFNANTMEVRARRVLDAKQYLSADFIDAAFTTMKVLHEVEPDEGFFRLSLLVPFVKYHTKWEDKDYSIEKNLGSKEHAYGGFWMNTTKSVRAETQEIVPYDPNLYLELDPIAERSLYELLAYAEEKGIELLFVDTPQYKTEKEMGRANTVYKILDEQGAKYINYCVTDAAGNFLYGLNLDNTTDFYKEGHVNYYGAEKFTVVMAKYLAENYDLPDRRNDEDVKKDWDGLYDKIVKNIAKFEAKKAKK